MKRAPHHRQHRRPLHDGVLDADAAPRGAGADGDAGLRPWTVSVGPRLADGLKVA